MKIVFDETAPFAASRAAEQWCEERGLSVGAMERNAPRGIDSECYLIGKWSHLNDSERRHLIGRMTGDHRHGPVTIEIEGDEALWDKARRMRARMEARG